MKNVSVINAAKIEEENIAYVLSKYSNAHCELQQPIGYVVVVGNEPLSNITTETKAEAWERAANRLRTIDSVRSKKVR